MILPHSLNVATPELAADSQYNILNYLGGAGPYFQYPGFGISPLPPPTCEVTLVYYIGRHGERYPTRSSGTKYNETITELKLQNLNGSLEFINEYEYFVTDPENYGEETTPENSVSIYNGQASAMRNGINFRERYGHLYDNDEIFPVFTSNSKRVHDSSINFMRGFMGSDYSPDKVKINIISEDAEMGANSLTPRNGCDNFVAAKDNAPEYPHTEYFDKMRKRLQKENPNLNITNDQLDTLFDICAYEINVRQSSPFCNIFTNDELVSSEMKQDFTLYNEVGKGNNYSVAAGSPYMKSLVKLLDQDSKQKIWISFTHDHDLVTFYSSIGLFQDKIHGFDRTFKQSVIVPQSTRVIIEKYKCNNQSYIRVNVNDAVIPLNCKYGPGFACTIEEFKHNLQDVLNIDYNEECGSNNPGELNFYWDYKTHNYLAPLEE